MKQNVRFVNYPEHYRRIWAEILPALTECLQQGDLIMRHQLKEFETNLAAFVGVKHAIGLNSGSDALFLSLKAAGIRPDDEVITVAHTFVATITAIEYCGAKPILIDIGEDMNMNVDLIESAITDKTKAIIPVHLNGRMCNMEVINKIAEKNNLLVIEDAAQALGASYNGKKAGSYGLTGCFSFYPAKILGCAGDGGAVVTNSDEVAKEILLLRDHGYDRVTGKITKYGYNSRLDNIQAAILNIKLLHLNEWINKRRYIASKYHKGLQSINNIILPPEPSNETKYFDVFQNYVIRVPNRDEVNSNLNNAGIETIISWPIPLHRQLDLNLHHVNLPNTDLVSKEVISLPLYPEISDEDILYVMDILKQINN